MGYQQSVSASALDIYIYIYIHIGKNIYIRTPYVKSILNQEVHILFVVRLTVAMVAHWRIAALHADTVVHVRANLQAKRVPVRYHGLQQSTCQSIYTSHHTTPNYAHQQIDVYCTKRKARESVKGGCAMASHYDSYRQGFTFMSGNL